MHGSLPLRCRSLSGVSSSLCSFVSSCHCCLSSSPVLVSVRRLRTSYRLACRCCPSDVQRLPRISSGCWQLYTAWTFVGNACRSACRVRAVIGMLRHDGVACRTVLSCSRGVGDRGLGRLGLRCSASCVHVPSACCDECVYKLSGRGIVWQAFWMPLHADAEARAICAAYRLYRPVFGTCRDTQARWQRCDCLMVGAVHVDDDVSGVRAGIGCATHAVRRHEVPWRAACLGRRVRCAHARCTACGCVRSPSSAAIA